MHYRQYSLHSHHWNDRSNQQNAAKVAEHAVCAVLRHFAQFCITLGSFVQFCHWWPWFGAEWAMATTQFGSLVQNGAERHRINIVPIGAPTMLVAVPWQKLAEYVRLNGTNSHHGRTVQGRAERCSFGGGHAEWAPPRHWPCKNAQNRGAVGVGVAEVAECRSFAQFCAILQN